MRDRRRSTRESTTGQRRERSDDRRTAGREAKRKHADVLVDLRDHRRPGEGDDVPLALPARAARAARLPDRRRRRRRLDRRPARRARARLDRRHRRARSTRRSSSASPTRLSYVAGRLRRRRRPTSASPRRSRAASTPVFYLEIPPFLFGRVVEGPRRGRADEERARRRREAVRPRPRVGAGARRRAAPVHRRVAALPDRPLPREDGPRGDPLPAVREHDARAGLEPELRRVACRSRWPRTSASRTAATSTTRSARCATSSSTT